MTVNDLFMVYLFFLVHAVKMHAEQHCFLLSTVKKWLFSFDNNIGN